MANDEKKREEGFMKIKLAEKSLTLTCLKWKPDYEIAADLYSQAATCFRVAHTPDKSKECFLKASECYKSYGNLFPAAKSLEQVILLSNELKDYKGMVEIAEKACDFYMQSGSPHSAATSLEKAAKILEEPEPESAAHLYQKAADIVLGEDSPIQAAEFLNKVAKIYVKQKKFDLAAKIIREQIGIHLHEEQGSIAGRLVVQLVLVMLARKDHLAADRVFRKLGACCEDSEQDNIDTLLRGYEEGDPDVVLKALENPFIKHLDVEYARLARDLPLPEDNFVPMAKYPSLVPVNYKTDDEFEGEDKDWSRFIELNKKILEDDEEDDAKKDEDGGKTDDDDGKTDEEAKNVDEEDEEYEGLC